MKMNVRKENKISNEMSMAVEIRHLSDAINEYLDEKRVLHTENIEFLKCLFVDIKEFVDVLYNEA